MITAAIGATIGTISTLFKMMGVPKQAEALLRKCKGAPSMDDGKLLVAFAALVDSRRVYHYPFEIEVFESCVCSLGQVKDEAEKTRTNITHSGAQAVLDVFVNDHRKFLDAWRGHRTPNHFHGHGERNDAQELAGFFDALGELRARTQMWMGALSLIEPKAKVSQFDHKGV